MRVPIWSISLSVVAMIALNSSGTTWSELGPELRLGLGLGLGVGVGVRGSG